MFNTGEIVEEAKRKRKLSDLSVTIKPENHNTITPEYHNYGNTVLAENHNTIKKVKITVYVPVETWESFNTIYGKRLIEKRKIDKGDLMAEAIKLLQEKERL